MLLLACAPAYAQTREQGNLVIDGVPEIPKRIVDRSNQYLSARGAAFLDWEPSGAGMLIATRFGDTSQVHFVQAPGMDRQQLTFFTEPVSSAVYGAKHADRGFFFRMDTGGAEFFQYYWFERATGSYTLVTDGKSRNETFLPSNGGARFAFSSTARNGKDFDIHVMNGFDGRTVKRVRDCEGQWNPLDWSRDDAQLLLHHFVSINESSLWTLDLVTGESKQLNPKEGKRISYSDAAFAREGQGKTAGGVFYTSDEDAEFRQLVYADLTSGKQEVLTPGLRWDVDSLALSPDGNWLAYVANEGGTSALYLAPADKPLAVKTRATRIALPKGVVSHIKFDMQSKRLGFAISTAQSTSDAFSVELKSRKLTRWTFSEVGGLNASLFLSPELVQYTSFDDRAISAWYYKPRTADAQHPAPVIINIHGGPESQSTAAFNPLIQYWANELGAAVLVPNVRGSSGYGKTFLELDNGAKREDSVKDIGHLLYWLGERPELDAKRVAVFGGSYGGYMVLAAMEAFPERIKCGVEIVGVANFVTFLERTEAYRRDLRRAEYGDERDPEMRKYLTRIAPTTNAAKIKAPLFVAQGKNDPRVPASQAEQIVKTVREGGGKVWYLLAKDEGHGFQKRVNRDFFNNATTLFFEEYLLK